MVNQATRYFSHCPKLVSLLVLANWLIGV